MINVVSLKGARADCRIESDGDSILLPATTNATGAAFQEWMGKENAVLSFRLREFSQGARMVICIHSGEEYGKGLYHDCIEWTISGKEITLRTPGEQIFRTPACGLSNDTKISVRKDADTYILQVGDNPYKQTHAKISSCAKAILYNDGKGIVNIDSIDLKGFLHPRRHLERVPEGLFPRPEYPRPDMKHEAPWQNLNGPAAIVFDPYREGDEKCWFNEEQFPHSQRQTILTPFPWQAPFSLVHEPLYYGDAWYCMSIRLQQDVALSDRVILRFGAVDYECTVWFNGKFIGENHNGHLPFEFDVTDALRPGEEQDLTIQARDRGEDRARLLGKQGTWYNHVSGIWQTFWLEGRSAVSLAAPAVRGSDSSLMVTGKVDGESRSSRYRVKWILIDKHETAAEGVVPIESDGTYRIDEPISAKLWSPGHPYLYQLDLFLISEDGTALDHMEIQVGFRTFEARDGSFFLNGEEIYLRGVLNQAFHPDGLYTYPSDDVIRGDLETAKSAGYNLVRLHIKVDEPRLYYWANKLGVLIWAEPPSWLDDGYNNPPAHGTDFAQWPKDSAKYRLWDTINGLVERDGHHPCIVIWGVINEGWGVGGWSEPEISTLDTDVEKQEFVQTTMAHVRKLDSTRPWVDNSACPNGCGHVDTDILDYHDYADFIAGGSADPVVQYQPWRKRMEGYNDVSTWRKLYVPDQQPKRSDEMIRQIPKMNSEYGAWPGRPWFSRDIGFSLQYLTNEIRRQPALKGYIYTELQDIAWELNGLLTYDRKLKDLGVDPLLTVNAPLYVGFSQPFLSHGSGKMVVHPFVRDDRYDPSNFGPFQILYRLLEDDIVGVERELASLTMEWSSFKTSGPVLLDPQAASYSPDGYIRRADIQILQDGHVLAHNWIWLLSESHHPSAGIIESESEIADSRFLWRKDSRAWVIHILPGESAEFNIVTDSKGDCVVLEMSSDSALHRQTMRSDSPANAKVRIETGEVKNALLSRGLSDARGILSWANGGPHPGLYGELVTFPMEKAMSRATVRVSCVPTEDAPHGVLVFGANSGRYPFASGIRMNKH